MEQSCRFLEVSGGVWLKSGSGFQEQKIFAKPSLVKETCNSRLGGCLEAHCPDASTEASCSDV